MNKELKKLGNAIEAARRKRGLSQKQFAELLKVTQSTTSHWEHGNIDVPYSTLCRIAAALEVSPAELADAQVPTPQNNINTERLDAIGLALTADPRVLEIFRTTARLGEAKLRVLAQHAKEIEGSAAAVVGKSKLCL